MTLGCRLKDVRARSSMNIQTIEYNKCVRRRPICRITNCKGAPLAKAIEDATPLVEWALTPRGEA